MNKKERDAWLNNQWKKGRKRMTRTRRDVSKYRGGSAFRFHLFQVEDGKGSFFGNHSTKEFKREIF